MVFITAAEEANLINAAISFRSVGGSPLCRIENIYFFSFKKLKRISKVGAESVNRVAALRHTMSVLQNHLREHRL